MPMLVSAETLEALRHDPEPLPAMVEPELWLAEEVVLLGLEAPHHCVAKAARVAGHAYPQGPSNYHQAISSLTDRAMVDRSEARGKPTATDAARVRDRVARVQAIIHRPASPCGRDAELLVALALAELAWPSARP